MTATQDIYHGASCGYPIVVLVQSGAYQPKIALENAVVDAVFADITVIKRDGFVVAYRIA